MLKVLILTEKVYGGPSMQLWQEVSRIFIILKQCGGMLLTIVLVFVGMVLINVFTATLTSLMVGDDSNQATDNLKLYVKKRLNDIDKRFGKISKSNGNEEIKNLLVLKG